jgi:hypothetical protein
MLISQSWVENLLRKVNPSFTGVSPEELDAAFVRVGFEVEGYQQIPATTGPLVLGRVESIEELTEFKKPIRHCMVDVGQANGSGELQSIVCGARNFAEGDTVVVVLPGAVLPGDFAISARETYGRMSAGMICSAAELGLTDKSTGIMTLDTSAGDPGDDARPVLGLDDTIFDVNITPDRGYALSARGLSRELASALNLEYYDPAAETFNEVPAVEGDLIGVALGEDTKARRFGLRKVSGIDPNAESPLWLQRELMLSGQRPVNAATDVTNYVMLLLGQPMHAFDADKIEGDLVVRLAQEGETLETLDHQVRKLDGEDVVICDDQGIQSLAAVMGGSTSEISETTTNVYFEAANWDPITTARTSRRHKLSSEASRRFERGVDPALIEPALDLACALLRDIAGGEIAPGRTLVGDVQTPAAISMSVSRPSELIGVNYTRETIIACLEEIGCSVVVTNDGAKLQVTPPTWRPDLLEAADLVEEIVRLEGLEEVPSLLPTVPVGRGLTPWQKRRRAIGHALAYNGYVEIIPTPFIRQDTFDTWGLDANDERRNAVVVQNPLDADYAVLGTTLLPSMLEALARNVARGRNDVYIYGQQQVSFVRGNGVSPMLSVHDRPAAPELNGLLDSLPYQPLFVATVGAGQLEFDGPWGEGREYTFADAIESAKIVARAAGVELSLANAEELPWHPGRCAALIVDDTVVGHAGELHPQLLERLGLPARTCAMELNVSALPLSESLPAPVLSPFPTLKQDLALVVDEELPAEALRAVIIEAASDLLESVELFDVYRSEVLGEAKKSLAFALTFRAQDRTLTDEECSVDRLAAADLALNRFGAEMRA